MIYQNLHNVINLAFIVSGYFKVINCIIINQCRKCLQSFAFYALFLMLLLQVQTNIYSKTNMQLILLFFLMLAINLTNLAESMSNQFKAITLSISQSWEKASSGQKQTESQQNLYTSHPQTQMQEILSFFPKGIQNLVEIQFGWIFSKIGHKLTSFASNFPTTSTVIGVSASATSAYAWNNQYGQSYEYSKLDHQLRTKLEFANSITQIEMYRSPLEDLMYFQHYQIVFEMDNMFWGLISLAKEGLETRVSLRKQELIARRENNVRKNHKNINVSPKKIINFLKEYQNKIYHTLGWNCQTFSTKLWKKITK